VNCHDLIGCTNLRGKSYCIFNVQYTKDVYQKKLQDMDLGAYNSILITKKLAYELFEKYPVKYLHGANNKDVTGDIISNSKNSHAIFSAKDLEDCEYVINGNQAKDCYECYVAVDKSERCFDSLGCFGAQNVKASHLPWSSYGLEYCDSCEVSSNLFGCVSLYHSEYAILNKKYSEKDFFELKEKIIEHMKNMPYKDKNGRVYNYGEFFPAEFSPYCYNETIALFYYPQKKEEALKNGFSWKDREQKDYKITINAKDLPNNIKNVDDSILEAVISCEHEGNCSHQCATAFKITRDELQLYRNLNLPLPRLCFNCRHYQRLNLENPRKLWPRKCQCVGEKSENGSYTNTVSHSHGTDSCQNEFETSYSPDRPEIVYCEKCYQAEVY
jgi:hypothetical protein